MADTLTNPMHVEVISPDGPIYSDDGVTLVAARAEDGEFAIMKNHLPLAAALDMCVVRVEKPGKEQRIAVFGGFLETKDSKVNIIAPLAELAETIHSKEIDMERAKLALMRALTRLHATKSI